MNERIKELIEECTDRHFSECVGGFETFDKEKFAQLIVAECASRVDSHLRDWLHDNSGGSMGDKLKQHFGVDE